MTLMKTQNLWLPARDPGKMEPATVPSQLGLDLMRPYVFLGAVASSWFLEEEISSSEVLMPGVLIKLSKSSEVGAMSGM